MEEYRRTDILYSRCKRKSCYCYDSRTEKYERQELYGMKWIKRLCSFIFLCILITGGILTYQGVH